MKKYSLLVMVVVLLGMMSCKPAEVEDLNYAENALTELVGEWKWMETRTNNPEYTETAEKLNVDEILCVRTDKKWSLSRNDTLIGNGIVSELYMQVDTICTGGVTHTYMKLYDGLTQTDIQRCYAVTRNDNDSTLCTYHHPCLGGDARKIWNKLK